MSSYGFPKKAEDSAAASGDDLCPIGGIRKDVPDTTTTSTDGDYSQISTDKRGILLTVPEPPSKATYGASSGYTTLAASATDFFTIYGSGTKIIKILKIYVRNASTGTTGTTDRISLIKRSTAPSSGTATTMTNVPLDSGNAAGTATVKIWTANPTVGTAVGTIMTRQLASQTTGDVRATPNDVTVYQGGLFFDSAQYGQALTLRGTGEGIALSLSGVTQSGTSPTMNIDVVWTEE